MPHLLVGTAAALGRAGERAGPTPAGGHRCMP
jgi:hypothetical protein